MKLSFNSIVIGEKQTGKNENSRRKAGRKKLIEVENEVGYKRVKEVKGFTEELPLNDEERKAILKHILDAKAHLEESNYCGLVTKDRCIILNHSGREVFVWTASDRLDDEMIQKRKAEVLLYIIKFYKTCKLIVKI